MTNEAMSPLRRRMIEDMTIRKFASKTQRDYVQRAFLGRSPDTASFEDNPLCEDIMACRARTLAGFAIQVRAASLLYIDLHEGNSDQEDYLAFVNAACAFAGVVLVASEGKAAAGLATMTAAA